MKRSEEGVVVAMMLILYMLMAPLRFAVRRGSLVSLGENKYVHVHDGKKYTKPYTISANQ